MIAPFVINRYAGVYKASILARSPTPDPSRFPGGIVGTISIQRRDRTGISPVSILSERHPHLVDTIYSNISVVVHMYCTTQCVVMQSKIPPLYRPQAPTNKAKPSCRMEKTAFGNAKSAPWESPCADTASSTRGGSRGLQKKAHPDDSR